MPSGYTSPILDDPDFTWEDFVWNTTRAFGFFGRWRDDPRGPIPLKEYEATFDKDIAEQENKLSLAQSKFEDFQNMSDEDLRFKWNEEKERAASISDTINEGYDKNLAKLTPFLEKAKALKSPTDYHDTFIVFLIQQIEDTIKWDATLTNGDRPKKEFDSVEHRSFLLGIQQREIRYASKRIDELKEAKKNGVEWITKLMEIVPFPKEK